MKINYYFPRYSIFIRIFSLLFVVLIFNSSVRSTTITIATSSDIFTPDNVTVSVGDTVKWQWINGVHTTTCGSFPGTSLPLGAASWDAPLNNATPVFTYVVRVSGVYKYVCVPHAPGMAGTIVANSPGSMLDENFNYTVGDSLGAHGWVSFSGGVTNLLAISTPGLSYAGYPLSNIGNATTVLTSGQDAYRNFSTADSTGTLYASFMVRITSAQTGDYFLALLPPTNVTSYTARFYAKDSSSGLSFGLSKSTAGMGVISYTGGSYSYGTTYLVVIKYQFLPGSGTDDVMNAYIFSSGIPATEPATPTIGPVTGTAGDNTLGRIALRQGTATSSPAGIVDGIRVTKTWSGIITSIKNTSQEASSFSLAQNYPNPFNPQTTIKFMIPDRGLVNLTVYNSLGMEVENLVNQSFGGGTYSVNFNGSALSSGVYFYKLTYSGNNGNNFTDTKKFILLK